MSWTDIFLIPFKVAQDRFKQQNPLIKCKGEDVDEISDVEIQIECKLRSDLIDKCAKFIWGLTTEQLQEMIFGADYHKYDVDMISILSRFKQEDGQVIIIDTLDKLIIDELIRRLNND